MRVKLELRLEEMTGIPVAIPRMDPIIKAQWLKDLRSGRFTQMKQLLRGVVNDKPRYCCIGVLCNKIGKWTVLTEETPNLYWQPNSGIDFNTGVPDNGDNLFNSTSDSLSVTELPESLLGLPEDVWIFLARLNDEESWTFEEIAEWVEEYL